MEQKDPRYLAVKYLLKKGEIKTFKDIFKHIPKTVVAGDMHTNNARMTRLINNPENFTLDELQTLADLIGYDYKKFVLFIADEYHQKKNPG